MQAASSYGKTFLGIRFLLYGFDPPDQHQVRSMLLSRGGIEAQDFTHLVVDNTIYDDPACVSARNDGKTVVTKLWVDHSFDIGLIVDATSVMYQPPKDLNGIPGAENLIICLTGYQRQDREDIMTMVRLMGAQFSKALVASKITHLICYKNEGEKYELARRVHHIKLVNHQWLEDCLRNWKILPEDEYSKSGYELELMAAEAMDSEDDVSDDTSLKLPTSRSINQTLQITRNASPKTSDLSKSTSKVPTTRVGSDGFFTVHNDEEVLITPVTKKKVDAASHLAGPSERTPGSAKAGDKMNSVSMSVEKPSNSNTKSSVISYHRKIPQRSPTALFVGTSKSLGCSPKVQIGEPIDVTSAEVEDAKKQSGSNSEISERLVSEQVSEGNKQRKDAWKSSPKSHNQQAFVTGSPAVSSGAQGLKSTTLAGKSDILPDGDHVRSGNGIVSPNAMLNSTNISSKEVVVTSREKSLVQELLFDGTTTLERTEHLSPDMKLQTSVGGLKELPFGGTTTLERTEHLSPEMKLQTPLGGLKELNSPTNNNSENFGAYNLKLVEGTNHQREASMLTTSDTNQRQEDNSLLFQQGGKHTATGKTMRSRLTLKNAGADKSKLVDDTNHQRGASMFTTSDTNQRQDDDSLLSKQFRKHTATGKMTGSRLKLKNSVNQKGSIYLKEVAAAKEVLATDPCIGNGGAENETNFSRVTEIDKPLLDVAQVDVVERELIVDLRVDIQDNTGFMDDETEPPDETFDRSDELVKERTETVGLAAIGKESQGQRMEKSSAVSKVDHVMEDAEKRDNSISERDGDTKKKSKAQRLPSSKSKRKAVSTVNNNSSNSSKATGKEKQQAAGGIPERNRSASCRPSIKNKSRKRTHSTMEADKENTAVAEVLNNGSKAGNHVEPCKTTANGGDQVAPEDKPASAEVGAISNHVEREPMFFMFSGCNRLQRKEFQKVIKPLKGKSWRDSHQWTYQATHLVAADPLRRTEKVFAAAASGRWILKTDYLFACSQEGKFLPEEPYEWHKKGVNEDGAVNLESPRKWRLLREKTGHGAFHGMRIVIYGECIAPPLDTLKRAVKAGGGTILATSPPYTRFLSSGIDYAVVAHGTLVVDGWVQEFLRHEIPCVVADYLVDYVCRTGYSLDKHVLFNTQKWADKSFSNLARKAEEIVVVANPAASSSPKSCINDDDGDDVACQVCGGRDRGDVMLLCGDQSGNVGCGVARHIDCCDPPLQSIPQEDWFCPNCSKDRNAVKPAKAPKRKKGKAS
ncbi:unnamed protein product [Linum trigynum]|uniref:BRCT domain-containing protein n=1 Tax=Linum trigynum TaxID=586398 RepID=A0AAV2FL37_9ROSI